MRPSRIVATAVALSLVLVACGNDGADAGSEQALQFEIVSAGEADEGIDGVEAFRIESADHTGADVAYSVHPPPGGPHHQAWASCGFYDEPRRDENVVHNLEHGAVWLAYSPDLPDSDVGLIRDLVEANPKTIAAPYEALEEGAAVVATAWARQLRLEEVDDPRLEAFVAQYQDGTQAPEAGVTCE